MKEINKEIVDGEAYLKLLWTLDSLHLYKMWDEKPLQHPWGNWDMRSYWQIKINDRTVRYISIDMGGKIHNSIVDDDRALTLDDGTTFVGNQP